MPQQELLNYSFFFKKNMCEYYICIEIIWRDILQNINNSYLYIVKLLWFLLSFLLFLGGVFFFCLFRATPTAWRFPGEESNQSSSCRPTPQPEQCQIQVESVTYTTAHGNAGSFTHSLHGARDGTHILMDPSRVLNPLSYNGQM